LSWDASHDGVFQRERFSALSQIQITAPGSSFLKIGCMAARPGQIDQDELTRTICRVILRALNAVAPFFRAAEYSNSADVQVDQSVFFSVAR
jgi:hypothetical protein